MDLSGDTTAPAFEADDVLPILDEELDRLPGPYRAALIACELEGKSRREAAEQLGIPEGTLSTHLARGRKRLRDRLTGRGVSLGTGPIVGLSRPVLDAALLERLVASGVSTPVSTLAERALKMMFLSRLTLVAVALLAVAAAATAAVGLVSPRVAEAPRVDPPGAGPDDLAGRVVDRTGAGVAGVQVWAMDGDWFTPETVATATTDAQGRYAVPWPRDPLEQRGSSRFKVFARSRDGRVGWQEPYYRRGRGDAAAGEIELLAVADARGRLTDQDGKPIAGVVVTAAAVSRTNVDFAWLSPEVRALFRTTTAADGSFRLRGIPQGSHVHATIASEKFGAPMVNWDASQAVAIVLESRLGTIRGRLRPPEGARLERAYPIGLEGVTRPGSGPHPFGLNVSRNLSTAADGSYRFDGLPPGRYEVNAYFNLDGIIAGKTETDVEVRPGAVATVDVPLRRVPRITGRIVDAGTGRGVAGVKLSALLRQEQRQANWEVGEATTDADGRYSIPVRPGDILVNIYDVPGAYLLPESGQRPSRKIETDWTAPDVKLVPAGGCEGVVVDSGGHPVSGAEVFVLMPDHPGARQARESLVTGSDGSFRLERLQADALHALWARSGDATTGEPVVFRPREVKGKVTLTVDPQNAVRIRGLAVDGAGRRVSGATVTLWWTRWDPVEKGTQPTSAVNSVLATATTGGDGWFVFRNLWPEVMYQVVVEARGHNSAEAAKLTGKAGETHDVGKVVLLNTSGHLAGRVVGSDSRPIAGVGVFNRGDGPEMVATSTDAEGRFRLDGLFAGAKYAFARKPGYRFAGIKAESDADDLTIEMTRADEPPPAWKPGTTASPDERRAFARHVLIRIWEKYGADTDRNGAFQCIEQMAGIDPDLARQWSAEKGHRYDDRVRQAEAMALADADPAGALALLNQKPDTRSQAAVQTLAGRFAAAGRKEGLSFAEEAAVQARGLTQPDRALAMAKAGALLVKLGRADAGRKLIDEAARDALQLPTERWAGACRAQVSGIVAAFDADRALAIIEPFRAAEGERWQARLADVAVGIAAADTKRAVELVDTVGGRGFDHELAGTAIAYRIGRDRPDEAIRIIEGIQRNRWAPEFQAGAFGWLAVAVAPRDRARAYGLIDRALAMMVDQRDWMGPDNHMAVAARVAGCARRIGYPDMGGVVMRVLAARPDESRGASGDRGRLIQRILDAAVPLALIDPAAARVVLEQVEVRGGLDPVTLWGTHQPWLIAWSLVDIEKARTILEAELASIERQKVDVSSWSMVFYQMVELLTAPPDRREEVLGRRSAGGYWRPEEP